MGTSSIVILPANIRIALHRLCFALPSKCKMAPSSTSLAPSVSGNPNKIPVNKRKLLDDSDSDSDDGGAPVEAEAGFKVNEEFARRFEHNKKREELHRCKWKHVVQCCICFEP